MLNFNRNSNITKHELYEVNDTLVTGLYLMNNT